MANTVAQCLYVVMEEVHKQDHGLLATQRRIICALAVNEVNTRLVAELNTLIQRPKESAGLWVAQVLVVVVFLRFFGVIAKFVPRWLMAFHIVLLARVLF